MLLTANTVLSLRVWSLSNRSLMMLRAGSTGTNVNRADTSQELRHSPGAKVMFYLFNKVLGTIDMVWGLANQRFEEFGKFLGHTIGDRSTTGDYRHEGSVWFVDLWEAIIPGGNTTCGVHGLVG